MIFPIPQKCIRYSLMAGLAYLLFEKYNIKYNLENCLLAVLSGLVLNSFFKRVEGFEGEEEPTMEEPAMEEPAMEEPAMEEPAMEEPAMEEPSQESPDQENEPEMVEEIVEEISDEPAQEEPSQESPAMEEPAQESPAMEEPAQEEPTQEEPAQEESEIKPYSSEELKKLQSKYTIMPVESWIKNEISLMQKSQQKNQSCACPTLSRASNDYLEF
jgi:outer membrane biosynthesis protein TonB